MRTQCASAAIANDLAEQRHTVLRDCDPRLSPLKLRYQASPQTL
jgi:hypothetical protein